MAAEIPEHVRRFIAQHVDSISLLDVLLLLRAVPDKRWTPQEVGRALVTGEKLAAGQLEHLEKHGLVSEEDGAFLYSPGATDRASVDELAECYARRRHTVIGLIVNATNRSATSLADAFRLRGRKR
jgi:hypothetical protein